MPWHGDCKIGRLPELKRLQDEDWSSRSPKSLCEGGDCNLDFLYYTEFFLVLFSETKERPPKRTGFYLIHMNDCRALTSFGGIIGGIVTHPAGPLGSSSFVEDDLRISLLIDVSIEAIDLSEASLPDFTVISLIFKRYFY